MATEFLIGAPGRVCAASGRELKPGDRFHGVLVDDGGAFARREYAPEAWAGPPEGAVAHWLGRIPPAAAAPKKPAFHDGLLFDCLDHLNGATDPHRVHFRYVVALLLMRRRKLKFEDSGKRPDGSRYLVVRDGRSGARLEIADPHLGEAEIAAVQDEVFRALGWD